MPQKGQKTVTLSSSKIPKKLIKIMEEYDQSLAGMTTYCLWLQFGNPQQKKKAQKIMRLFN